MLVHSPPPSPLSILALSVTAKSLACTAKADEALPGSDATKPSSATCGASGPRKVTSRLSLARSRHRHGDMSLAFWVGNINEAELGRKSHLIWEDEAGQEAVQRLLLIVVQRNACRSIGRA